MGAFRFVLEELIVQRGEEQRRRLAADPRDGEQNAGDEPGAGGPVGDPFYDGRTRQAESARRFTQGSGNEQQHVLGRPHDDRNDDHRQRDGAGYAREMAHRARP